MKSKHLTAARPGKQRANSVPCSLTFPPMDASARKIIHELANKFNIKSKSAGHGETRRPSLYRTKRTVRYSEPSFEQIFARAGRRYFPRLDVKGRAPRGGGGGGGGTGRPGRGVNHAAFTLKDGEVVGGGAPELDQANKGRAMLEKMGWSTGMALGSQVRFWQSSGIDDLAVPVLASGCVAITDSLLNRTTREFSNPSPQ